MVSCKFMAKVIIEVKSLQNNDLIGKLVISNSGRDKNQMYVIVDNIDDNFDINKDYGYISIYTHNGRNVFVTNKVDELNLLKSKYASLDTDVVIDGE